MRITAATRRHLLATMVLLAFAIFALAWTGIALTRGNDRIVYRGTGIVATEHYCEQVDHGLVIRLLIIRHWVSPYFPSVSSLERLRRSEENVRDKAYRRIVPVPLDAPLGFGADAACRPVTSCADEVV